ncbi:MAG: 2-C-methyl-D-erythritol 2,4-cyclodiphosphate synthase [Acidimicrobiia bacterium]|nr:MAG: 2-C-methyl-D-erythritol 2,4-cyclodiphosphate synthase [Acidimicrobiia bacterium]
MMGSRVGMGYDAHRFGGAGPVILAGVPIEHPVGVLGTSDADVAAHAVCDALLGAAALGDLGNFFPSDDEQWHGADSMELVATCGRQVRSARFELGSVDVTIIVEAVRVAPYRDEMRSNLALALQLPILAVSVKATTTDGLGWIGSGEGLAAHAVATIYR